MSLQNAKMESLADKHAREEAERLAEESKKREVKSVKKK